MNDTLMESGEMYLETILILSDKQDLIRSIDVVEYMGFSKPAVSRAMKKLREGRFIIIDSEGYIALTGSGRELAEKIYDRHRTLTEFLVGLGVGRENAAADACKMEHDISDESYEAIKKHIGA
ncbi:MAG: metal-dependent transcriptional regulator [Clostridia bacterium]|nr:metal-dependent transcriptional regulator [Clostridia bacterium]